MLRTVAPADSPAAATAAGGDSGDGAGTTGGDGASGDGGAAGDSGDPDMIGWWECLDTEDRHTGPRPCPVTVAGPHGDLVKLTIYRTPSVSIIVLASWATTDVDVTLKFDWSRVFLPTASSGRAVVTAKAAEWLHVPTIPGMQGDVSRARKPQKFKVDDGLRVGARGGGWLFVVEKSV